MLEGCMEITLSDEALAELCEADGFSADIPIIEQRTLSERDTDWEDVCYSFYHACGGMLGCGDVDAVEDLIIKYQTYFEETCEEEE
jgi:hypothetical protein